MSAEAQPLPEPWRQPIILTELQEADVQLRDEESRFLLAEHQKHVTLQPVADGGETWRVRPEAYCGSLPLPTGRCLYIEPKVGIGNLWRMLAWAYDLLELFSEVPVPKSVDELIESVVEVFAHQVDDLILQGLLRGYEPRTENLLTMRGRLTVAAHLRANAVARHRLLCDYDEFTTDIVENRILRWTLHLMLRAGHWHDRVRMLVDRCERRMAEASLAPVGDREFAELRYTRLNERYRTPLMLARLLLDMLSVTHRYGEREMLPLLLHMPSVFERFLERALRERLAPEGLIVVGQDTSRRLDVGHRVTLKPDAVIYREGKPVLIVDAKYKRTGFDEESEEDRTKARNADIYQMMAYCVGYGVGDAVLIYPEKTERETIEIRQNGVDVTVHGAGIDLDAGKNAFDRRLVELCMEVARLAAL
jgi:5-methylcytosine-specific restriction enzyme subunit McrC